MEINAKGMHFAELDRLVKDSADENIVIDNVLGQRYIAAGAHGKHITINGIPATPGRVPQRLHHRGQRQRSGRGGRYHERR